MMDSMLRRLSRVAGRSDASGSADLQFRAVSLTDSRGASLETGMRGESRIPAEFEPELVSVIIPTLNRADLVMQAIQTVRQQTWPHVQIIVVDNGSSDATVSLVSQLPDVTLLHQPKRGQAAARNLGLSLARGEFICTLDSDDLWHPAFLENCLKAMREVNADFVFTNWIGMNGQGRAIQSYYEELYQWYNFPRTECEGWRIMEPEPARAMYLDSCVSPSSSLVFRRHLVAHGWTEYLNIGDDWCLLMDAVVSQPCRVAFTMQRLWFKRVQGDNIYDQRDFFETLEKLLIQDAGFFLRRFWHLLTATERATLLALLTKHHCVMARYRWNEGKRAVALSAYVTALNAFVVGSSISLPAFMTKVRAIMTRPPLPPPVPQEAMDSERFPRMEADLLPFLRFIPGAKMSVSEGVTAESPAHQDAPALRSATPAT